MKVLFHIIKMPVNLKIELQHKQQAIPVITNNNTTLKFDKKEIIKKLTKHIDMCYHYLKKNNKNKIIKYTGDQGQQTMQTIC